MDVGSLVQKYGYAAVAVGCFLEGEAILLAAGFAAYLGHLDLTPVMLVAAIASFLGDQPYFYAGRKYGPSLLRRFPSVEVRAGRINDLLQRHDIPVLLSLRFLYGLRIAGLLALGMSKVSPTRFQSLNFIGAMVWSVVVATTGYGIGRITGFLLQHVSDYGIWMLYGVLLCMAFWFSWRRR